MSRDEFTKLFTYMEDSFRAIEKQLNQTVTKTEFNVFMNAIDTFAKRMEIYDHERLALGNQVDRTTDGSTN